MESLIPLQIIVAQVYLDDLATNIFIGKSSQALLEHH
jgi:hypothetical protein